MKIQMRFHKDIGTNMHVDNNFLATLQEYMRINSDVALYQRR